MKLYQYLTNGAMKQLSNYFKVFVNHIVKICGEKKIKVSAYVNKIKQNLLEPTNITYNTREKPFKVIHNFSFLASPGIFMLVHL